MKKLLGFSLFIGSVAAAAYAYSRHFSEGAAAAVTDSAMDTFPPDASATPAEPVHQPRARNRKNVGPLAQA